ncbi:RAMP superfamily CRISPR-associated protein [Roseateles sp. GG27B]
MNSLSSMTELHYRLSFATPAFLGNAQQQAQWRTPPIKALIRQWWRVVKAPLVEYKASNLLAAENQLFGAAGKEGANWGKSRVRLRLEHWNPGNLKEWPDLDIKARHAEVQGGRDIGADLYLGFGPLEFSRTLKRTALGVNKSSGAQRTAIGESPNAKSDQVLSLRVPTEHLDELKAALQLAAWFGTLGSRSRNGWGSLDWVALESTPALLPLSSSALVPFTRPLASCFEHDWPHSVGLSSDGRPAVWLSSIKTSWRDVMRDLAVLKIAFRTSLSLEGVVDGVFALRHLLAYPVTNHGVREWGGKARLGGQIRFKLARVGADWQARVVHLPCALPAELLNSLSAGNRRMVESEQLGAWQSIHAVLDKNIKRLA